MMQDNTIFFQCKVLNTDDPLMLGRIRGVRLIDNLDDILKGVSDPSWNESTDIWTERDPLVITPLLPYFIYQVPKVDELVQVLYVNKDYPNQGYNQFYVQTTFSSPTATYYQYNFGGNKFTGTGLRIQNSKPLRNQDGTFTNQALHAGVFPMPGDNALLGRGSGDLIVKENDVLLRVGKFKDEVLLNNTLPVANPQRGFLQLSRFQSSKQRLEDKTIVEFKEQYLSTNYLIEWYITNPENTQDKFNGSIYLYQLKPDISTSSKSITVDSAINENVKTLVYTQNFNLLSKLDTIKFINNFIKTCNDSNEINGINIFPNTATKFPIYYRPANSMYAKLSSFTPSGSMATSAEIKNISEIYIGVKLLPTIKGGFGLIYAKNSVGVPTTPIIKNVPQTKYVSSPVTYGALGSDKFFLLSHNSQIPGKGKINFDNSLYGFSSDQFEDEILPKTSSLVRGEELLELINIIVRFLITHTHAYPGLPPVSITQDGSSIDLILKELQNATNKILNTNIRLN